MGSNTGAVSYPTPGDSDDVSSEVPSELRAEPRSRSKESSEEEDTRSLRPSRFAYLLQGVLMSAFGLYFLISPSHSENTLATIVGLFFLVQGVIALLQAWIACCCILTSWMMCVYIFSFLVNTTLGVLIIVYPNESFKFIFLCIGVWCTVMGLVQLFFAWASVRGSSSASAGRGSSANRARGTSVFAGRGSQTAIVVVAVLYIVLGILFLTNLNGSVKFLIRVLGVAALLFGLQLVYLGVTYRTTRVNANTGSSDVV